MKRVYEIVARDSKGERTFDLEMVGDETHVHDLDGRIREWLEKVITYTTRIEWTAFVKSHDGAVISPPLFFATGVWRYQSPHRRVYQVAYRDILMERKLTIELESDSIYDKPELERRIKEHLLAEIDYPYTIPYTVWQMNGNQKPLLYYTGEVEQAGPIVKRLSADPYKDGIRFHCKLKTLGLPDDWWNGFRDSMNHDDEEDWKREQDDEIKRDQAAGIAYDRVEPWEAGDD